MTASICTIIYSSHISYRRRPFVLGHRTRASYPRTRPGCEGGWLSAETNVSRFRPTWETGRCSPIDPLRPRWSISYACGAGFDFVRLAARVSVPELPRAPRIGFQCVLSGGYKRRAGRAALGSSSTTLSAPPPPTITPYYLQTLMLTRPLHTYSDRIYL